MAQAGTDEYTTALGNLMAVFPDIAPESLEVVLQMQGGHVEKAAQCIYDLLQQQEMVTDEEDDTSSGPTSYVTMKDAGLPPAIRRVVRQSPWFARLPFIAADAKLNEVVPHLQKSYAGEFHCALSFDPHFLAQLMRFGYLTMAERLGPDLYVLLPKMHSKRCLLQFSDVHVEKNVRKRCKNFTISTDAAFERVLEGCIKQHGEAWLYKPLREAFTRIHHSGGMLGVTMNSFELWDGDELVAGEFGSTVGGCYTALSGFKLSKYASSGTIQMCATAEILRQAGCVFWDLGMELPYKLRLGAKSIEREVFLEQFVQCREMATVDFGPYQTKTNCAHYLQRPQTPHAVPEVQMVQMEDSQAPQELSKSQKKKLAKQEKLRKRKLQRLALAEGKDGFEEGVPIESGTIHGANQVLDDAPTIEMTAPPAS